MMVIHGNSDLFPWDDDDDEGDDDDDDDEDDDDDDDDDDDSMNIVVMLMLLSSQSDVWDVPDEMCQAVDSGEILHQLVDDKHPARCNPMIIPVFHTSPPHLDS